MPTLTLRCAVCGRTYRTDNARADRLRGGEMSPLLADYRCRTCNGGHNYFTRGSRASTQACRAAAPTPAAPVAPVEGVTVATDVRVADMVLDSYHPANLLIGFEIEGGGEGYTASLIAETFGLRPDSIGHTGGAENRRQEIPLPGGGSIQIRLPPQNRYKEAGIIADIYEDPSIGPEVVTRPVRLSDLWRVRDIHTRLKQLGADFFRGGRGGCHITITTDPHKELSYLNPIVVQNITQLVRLHFRDMVLAFPGGPGGHSTRRTYFRQLPIYANVREVVDLLHINEHAGSHYVAVRPRYRDANPNEPGTRAIWGVEIRLPDGTADFGLLDTQARFWAGVVYHAAMVAKYCGRIVIPRREIIRENEEFHERFINIQGARSYGVARASSQAARAKLENIFRRALDKTPGYFLPSADAEREERESISATIAGLSSNTGAEE